MVSSLAVDTVYLFSGGWRCYFYRMARGIFVSLERGDTVLFVKFILAHDG